MKLVVSYQNGAKINTGSLGETMSPVYRATWEFDLPVNTNKEDVTKEMVKKMKTLIDPMVKRDMKTLVYARMKCSCKPLFIKGGLQHDETCLMGTAVLETKKEVKPEATVKDF